MDRAHSGLVNLDAYPLARERIAQLIERARSAVGQIQLHQPDTDSTALFKATWTASQAAGFLEAFALMDPVLAGEMLADFESVAGLFDTLRATGRAGNDWTSNGRGVSDRPGQELPTSALDLVVEQRLTSRPVGNIPGVADRPLTADRRMYDRRQVPDRRSW